MAAAAEHLGAVCEDSDYNSKACSSAAASTNGASAALMDLLPTPPPGVCVYTAGLVAASAKKACDATHINALLIFGLEEKMHRSSVLLVREVGTRLGGEPHLCVGSLGHL